MQDVTDVQKVSYVEGIENAMPEVDDDNIDSLKDQGKQDFEISYTSEQDGHELIRIQEKEENIMANSIFNDDQRKTGDDLYEVKSIGYDFEYDFVGSNGTETRRLALDTTVEDESEGSESQHYFQNTTLQEENDVFHLDKEQNIESSERQNDELRKVSFL